MTDSGRSLRDSLEDYLALRRALGFKLATPARLLGQFVGWLEARGVSTITIADALAWAVLPAGASPAWQAIRLGAVRGLAAAYLHGTDPSVQVPPAGLIRRTRSRPALPPASASCQCCGQDVRRRSRRTGAPRSHACCGQTRS